MAKYKRYRKVDRFKHPQLYRFTAVVEAKIGGDYVEMRNEGNTYRIPDVSKEMITSTEAALKDWTDRDYQVLQLGLFLGHTANWMAFEGICEHVLEEDLLAEPRRLRIQRERDEDMAAQAALSRDIQNNLREAFTAPAPGEDGARP